MSQDINANTRVPLFAALTVCVTLGTALIALGQVKQETATLRREMERFTSTVIELEKTVSYQQAVVERCSLTQSFKGN